jgi:2-methylcitrate dehydratase PrpD
MGQQIENLAAFVATTQWEDVPATVRDYAKLVFLDTLGVILAGSDRPEVKGVRERLAATAGRSNYARGSASSPARRRCRCCRRFWRLASRRAGLAAK